MMRHTGSRTYYRPSPPKMPPGLVELMEGLAREVLKHNPTDVYGFCASHMHQLLEKRDGPSPKKTLSLEQKIAKAQEKVRQRAKIRRQEYDKEIILQQQSNASDNDVKQELTVHVLEVPTPQTPQNVSTVSDTVKENIPNTAMHHEQASESSAVLEISHESSSDIHKPIDNSILSECDDNAIQIKDCLNENEIVEAVKVELLENSEALGITASSNDGLGNKVAQDVSPNKNLDIETETKQIQNLESTALASGITSVNTIDEPKENMQLDLDTKVEVGQEELVPVESNNSETGKNATVVNEENGQTDVLSENRVAENSLSEITVERAKYISDDVAILENPTNSGGVHVKEGPDKIGDSQEYNDIPQTSVKEEQISNTSTVHAVDIQLSTRVEDTQVLNATTDIQTNMCNNALTTDASEGIKLADNTPVVPQVKNTQEENVPNAVQELSVDRDASPFKSEEDVEALINTAPDKTLNVTKDTQQANISDEYKKHKHGDQNAIVELKEAVVSKPETRFDLLAADVDRDIPTMVTEDAANDAQDIDDFENDTIHSKEDQNDNISAVDNGNAGSENTVAGQDYKDNFAASNANSTVHSNVTKTENDEIRHDGTSYIENIDETQNNKDNSNMDLETAAITIQKVFRTFLFKSRGSTFEDTANDEGNFMDEDDKNKEECDFPIASALNIDRRAHGITRMDTVLQTVNEEKSLSLSTDDSSTLSSAATIIQAHVRGFLVRNKLNSNKTVSTNSLAASNSNEPSITSLEADNNQNKNKTILNIHIVPEGENCFSRDESLITSMDLSLDSSPPSSINLHPLGYDISERRKQLKREDAIQSISPPSNNSGKLSEDLDSVKELSLNDRDVVEQVDNHDIKITKEDLNKESRKSSPVENGSIETGLQIYADNMTNKSDDSVTLLKEKRKSFIKMSSDEMDVVTPFIPDEVLGNSNLMHSGEFHDAVLPTRVSRSDTSVVSGE